MAARGRARAAPLWLLAAAASLLVVAAAATGRPGASGCTSALVSLSPCVDYMSGIGSEATALGRCCSQLRSVARSRPRCLCAALRVDRTRTLSLPSACSIQTWGRRCSVQQ
ncbi:hypothetical protein SETIT_9G130000v2 [Setaria italica]|uniref:Bifunctional inhibitor/plant lipid transfer protein/seed storage helical domain-containing protein n=1 Tax=Setaria italica TaxID=4555 RepID=K4AJP5_SETIT|nr:non-specific lipid-transfer protein-like protein At2g13820 [Setaria italica]RCV41367.1 hypothetical protein SETIT_9G130000v2 [Setaria italica]